MTPQVMKIQCGRGCSRLMAFPCSHWFAVERDSLEVPADPFRLEIRQDVLGQGGGGGWGTGVCTLV